MNFTIPEAWLTNPIRILVLGCGGTGSDLVDVLARLHFSLLALGHPHGLHVTLQDGDTVSAANIGRQRFVPADVGHNKAVVLTARYNFAYGLGWIAIDRFHDPADQIRDTDLLLTCTDKASVRVGIAKTHRVRARQRRPDECERMLWLDFGNGSASAQAVMGHLWSWPNARNRLPNFYDLYPNAVQIADDDAPSCSAAEALRKQEFGINRMIVDAGLFTVLVPLLTKGSITHHGAFVDMAKGRVTPLMIDEASWAFIRKNNRPSARAEGRPPARQRSRAA